MDSNAFDGLTRALGTRRSRRAALKSVAAGLIALGGVKGASAQVTPVRNLNCSQNYEVCRNGRCVNQSSCSRCNIAADCPSGQICRNGRCVRR